MSLYYTCSCYELESAPGQLSVQIAETRVAGHSHQGNAKNADLLVATANCEQVLPGPASFSFSLCFPCWTDDSADLA